MIIRLAKYFGQNFVDDSKEDEHQNSKEQNADLGPVVLYILSASSCREAR